MESGGPLPLRNQVIQRYGSASYRAMARAIFVLTSAAGATFSWSHKPDGASHT